MTSASPAGPDFLCVGAQKAGTGRLYDQLADHPQFWMPPIKELHYFDMAEAEERERRIKRALRVAAIRRNQHPSQNWASHRPELAATNEAFFADYIAAMQAPIDIDRYMSLFSCKGSLLSGDVTPGYSILDAARIDGLRERLPALKIVFIARHPVERLWSQYCMHVRRGRNSGSEGVEEILAFAADPGVAGRSFPSAIVKRWRERWPAGQFGLFFFDDLCADVVETRRRIITFLGGDADLHGIMEAGYNRKERQKKLPLPDEVRERLIGLFAEEIRCAADELGGPAIAWRAALPGS